MKYQYVNVTHSRINHGRPVEFRSAEGPCDPEGLARDAAHHLYRVNAGDIDWPNDLEIFVDGRSIGIYHVEMIEAPQFFAVPCTPESYA